MDSPQRSRPPGKAPATPPCFKITVRSCVALPVMAARGWCEVSGDYNWDIFWSAPPLSYSSLRRPAALLVPAWRSTWWHKDLCATGRTYTC